MGRIDEVNWPADSRVQIKCRLLGTEPRTSISLAWGRECPYTVFDHNCRADREQYRVPFTVELRDGNSVTGAGNAIGGYPDAWFRGGYVEWDSGQGVIEQRGIQLHTGNRLVLVGGTSLLAPGTRAVAFPGCDQLIQTCNDKFDNTPNCGAVPFLPGKSPFDGDPWW
ncbi:phage BR0599 family protein, partial [Pseudomonas aeruginosa]